MDLELAGRVTVTGMWVRTGAGSQLLAHVDERLGDFWVRHWHARPGVAGQDARRVGGFHARL